MTSQFLQYLQNGPSGNFGINLHTPPSRIVPLTFQDMEETYEEKIDTIRYLSPDQEEAVVYCKKDLDRLLFYAYVLAVQGNSCDISASVLSLPHLS